MCERCRESWPNIAAMTELGEELEERHADEKDDAHATIA